MKSITGSLCPAGASVVVLPPTGTYVPSAFKNVDVNEGLRSTLMAEMQRFRGSVYLHDGAVQSRDLSSDGRHLLPVDDHSWHVLTLNQNGTLSACLRFLPENTSAKFDDLWLRHAAITKSPVWGRKLRTAVETEMMQAKRAQLSFGEVGGWAVAPDRRLTIEPLRTILSTYGLLQLLGGCRGLATATSRHSSAPMLRRIGLSPLAAEGEELPPYYDPQYRCEMEILRFDSRYPNPKYQNWIDELGYYLSEAPVVSGPMPDARPRVKMALPWRTRLVPALVPADTY